METVFNRLKLGSVIALVCVALAVLVWFAPITLDSQTRKVAMATGLVNGAVMPVVDVIGKWSAIALLSLIAALGLAYTPSVKSDDTPILPKRKRKKKSRTKRRKVEAEAHDEVEAPIAARKRTLPTLSEGETASPLDTDDPEIIRQGQELAAEWQRRGTPHGIRIDPIAIVRKRREKGRDWSQDTSHFGGLPRLGEAEWPRDESGTPLPFIAQLDLAELAEANPDTPLPKTGSLAFFIGAGAVIHVPEGDHPHTPSPDDLPHAYIETNYPLPERPSPVTRQLFPFWPVDTFRLHLPDDLPEVSGEYEDLEAIENAQDRALDALVEPRKFSVSTKEAAKLGIEGADTMWWYGADLVLRQMRTALEAANRENLPRLEEDRKGLAEVIHHFENFVRGRAPWEVMSNEEAQILEEVMRKVRSDFEDLYPHHVSYRIEDIRSACLRRMITGDQAAAEAIPDAVLDYINEKLRRPLQYPHLMFGVGGCIQYNRDDHMCDHLLLQLSYDDMAELGFPDMGLFQFWISPEAMAEGDFSKAQLTFECS